jgi:hypothetical protein
MEDFLRHERVWHCNPNWDMNAISVRTKPS